MHHTQARRILVAFYPQDSKSGSFKVSKDEDKAGLVLETWTRGKSVHSSPTDRDVRYLAAYTEICRQPGPPFYAGGIPLNDDRLWLDRAVMNTLLTHNLVTLDPTLHVFHLTDAGIALVKSIPRPKGLADTPAK